MNPFSDILEATESDVHTSLKSVNKLLQKWEHGRPSTALEDVATSLTESFDKVEEDRKREESRVDAEILYHYQKLKDLMCKVSPDSNRVLPLLESIHDEIELQKKQRPQASEPIITPVNARENVNIDSGFSFKEVAVTPPPVNNNIPQKKPFSNFETDSWNNESESKKNDQLTRLSFDNNLSSVDVFSGYESMSNRYRLAHQNSVGIADGSNVLSPELHPNSGWNHRYSLGLNRFSVNMAQSVRMSSNITSTLQAFNLSNSITFLPTTGNTPLHSLQRGASSSTFNFGDTPLVESQEASTQSIVDLLPEVKVPTAASSNASYVEFCTVGVRPDILSGSAKPSRSSLQPVEATSVYPNPTPGPDGKLQSMISNIQDYCFPFGAELKYISKSDSEKLWNPQQSDGDMRYHIMQFTNEEHVVHFATIVVVTVEHPVPSKALLENLTELHNQIIASNVIKRYIFYYQYRCKYLVKCSINQKWKQNISHSRNNSLNGTPTTASANAGSKPADAKQKHKSIFSHVFNWGNKHQSTNQSNGNGAEGTGKDAPAAAAKKTNGTNHKKSATEGSNVKNIRNIRESYGVQLVALPPAPAANTGRTLYERMAGRKKKKSTSFSSYDSEGLPAALEAELMNSAGQRASNHRNPILQHHLQHHLHNQRSNSNSSNNNNSGTPPSLKPPHAPLTKVNPADLMRLSSADSLDSTEGGTGKTSGTGNGGGGGSIAGTDTTSSETSSLPERPRLLKQRSYSDTNIVVGAVSVSRDSECCSPIMESEAEGPSVRLDSAGKPLHSRYLGPSEAFKRLSSEKKHQQLHLSGKSSLSGRVGGSMESMIDTLGKEVMYGSEFPTGFSSSSQAMGSNDSGVVGGLHPLHCASEVSDIAINTSTQAPTTVATEQAFCIISDKPMHAVFFKVLEAVIARECRRGKLSSPESLLCSTQNSSSSLQYDSETDDAADAVSYKSDAVSCDGSLMISNKNSSKTGKLLDFLKYLLTCDLSEYQSHPRRLSSDTQDLDNDDFASISYPKYLMHDIVIPRDILTVQEWCCTVLFAVIPGDVVVKILSMLLLEKSLLVCSQYAGLITVISSAFTYLLKPFTWEGIFVPMLPMNAVEVLDAPVPYIIGMLVKGVPNYTITPTAGILYVDDFLNFREQYALKQKIATKNRAGANANTPRKPTLNLPQSNVLDDLSVAKSCRFFLPPSAQEMGNTNLHLTNPHNSHTLHDVCLYIHFHSSNIYSLLHFTTARHTKHTSASVATMIKSFLTLPPSAMKSLRHILDKVEKHNNSLCGNLLNAVDGWRQYGEVNPNSGLFDFQPELFMAPLRERLQYQESVIHTQLFVSFMDKQRVDYLNKAPLRIFLADWIYYRLHLKRKDKKAV